MLKEYQVSTPSIDWCVDVSVPVCYEVMFLVCLGSICSVCTCPWTADVNKLILKSGMN